jgi:hypothetical protein
MSRPRRKYKWVVCCKNYWYVKEIDKWFEVKDFDLFVKYTVSNSCTKLTRASVMKQVRKLIHLKCEDVYLYKLPNSSTRKYKNTKPKLWII